MQTIWLQIFLTKKCQKKKCYVIIANKKYYTQTLLEECKYVQGKIKTENHIDDDLVDQIVTLMMKQNLILILMNMTNNFCESILIIITKT